MPRNVIKNFQLKDLGKKYIIPPPKIEVKEPIKEEKGEEEVLLTLKEQVRKEQLEIDRLRKEWEEERHRIEKELNEKKEKILKEADDLAFSKIKSAQAQSNLIIEEAKKQAEKIIQDARFEANNIINDAKENSEKIVEENRKKGYDEGFEKGFNEGFEETKRLTEMLHKIISEIMNKRIEIIEGTEYQIISIVMLIVKKVIKVISEHQKTVIINNIIEALKKVKNTRKIIIRVNVDDLQVCNENMEKFINLVEGLKEIQFVEDSTVDKGGCIIETDFGEIDARISLQLKEIEDKILELVPVKRKLMGEGKE
ncbi:MAG: flagellar assembly protein FliH [Spirochaetes bacterium]|nr:flagellar assembly protein FliH [Spirochaetota bacterium]